MGTPANPATIPALAVGGRIMTDLTNLICLIGGVVSSGRYCTMRKPENTTGYQVPSGKVFRVLAIQVHCITTAANSYCSPGYGDNDVDIDAAAAPTNFKVIGQNANCGPIPLPAAGYYEVPMKWDIPASKYPAAIVAGATGTSVIKFWGYEI